MKGDVFGNLRDWSRVLDQVAEFREAGTLDEHQQGLTRLLRYRDNWRLRETALKAAKCLKSPSEELLSQVLAVMMDEDVYWQARVLAADTLSHLISECGKAGNGNLSTIAFEAMGKMESILDSPQPPVMHESIRRFLTAMEKTR